MTQEQVVRQKPRRWWRWPLRVVIAVLAAGAIYSLWKAVEDHFDRPALAATLAALDENERPWRLEDLQGDAAGQDASGSARGVVEVADLLPNGIPTIALEVSLKKALGRLESNEDMTSLARNLDKRQIAVEKARAIRQLPPGRFVTGYEGEYVQSQERNSERVRLVTDLLRYDSIRRAHAGDLPGALESCQAMVAGGRSFSDEAVAISQETRAEMAGKAAATLELVLNLGEAGEGPLRETQRWLEEEEAHMAKAESLALRGERALVQRRYEDFAAGRLSRAEIRKHTVQAGRLPLDDRFGWLWWRSPAGEHRQMLQILTEAIEIASLPPQERAERGAALINNKVIAGSWRRRFGWGPFFPGNLVGRPYREAQVRLRVMQALLAAERYRLREGRWPADLSRLVPAYLPGVPLDPFDGESLRCSHRDGGLVVYSVGLDGRDDGGDLTVRGLFSPPPPDMGARLLAPGKRRQRP